MRVIYVKETMLTLFNRFKILSLITKYSERSTEEDGSDNKDQIELIDRSLGGTQ